MAWSQFQQEENETGCPREIAALSTVSGFKANIYVSKDLYLLITSACFWSTNFFNPSMSKLEDLFNSTPFY